MDEQQETHVRYASGEVLYFPFRVCTGGLETMTKIAQKGLKGLNGKTMRYQVIDKNAHYLVIKDREPIVSEEYGVQWLATLYSDLDLQKIAEQKGLGML